MLPSSLAKVVTVALLNTVFFCPPPSAAAVIRKMDGAILEGEIRLDTPGNLTFFPRIGQPQRFPLEDILLAQFKGSPADSPPSTVQRWKGQDIGQGLPGNNFFTAGSLVIRASGANMAGNRDDLHFVYQPLTGDAQVSVRVLNITRTDPMAIAGVMIRDSLDTAAPYAMCLINAGGGSAMQHRHSLGAQSVVRIGNALSAPAFVKIARRGSSFTAFTSADGQNWEQLGTEPIPMRPQALVGIAVCSRNAAAVCTANFERIAITTGKANTAENQGGSGVMLRDGSIISGQVLKVDGSSIHLARPREGQLAIPQAEVARIFFTPAARDLATKAPPRQNGVLLIKGDFLEGEVQGIANNQVRLSSVLFGLQQLELSQTAAAIIRPLSPTACNYQVCGSDGSVINTNQLTIEKDALVAPSPAGPLRFTTAEVTEIRSGPLRYRSLVDIKPAASGGINGGPSGGNAVIDGATAGVGLSLLGNPVQRGVSISAATSVSYNLDGGYRLLSATWGIPDGIAPLAPLQLHIIGDNKDLYTSPPRTALDDPLPLAINLAGVKVLRIEVHATLPTPISPGSLLADPALVK